MNASAVNRSPAIWRVFYGVCIAVMAVSGQEPASKSLYFTIRDFSRQHPDFEEDKAAPTYCGYEFNAPPSERTKGMVDSTLGADRKPVHSSANTCPTKDIDSWFRDGTGNPATGAQATYCIEVELQPVQGTQNTYRYDSDAFFPIDDRPTAEMLNGHNFHFTMETHAAFQYRGGEIFKFVGDDDVWVFINGRLAVDLGGVHHRDSQTVDLDAQAEQLGITRGNYYHFDMFYCERHTDNSTLHLQTSIDFLPPSPEGVFIGDLRQTIIPSADTLILDDQDDPYVFRGLLVENIEEELECQRVISQTTRPVSGTWFLEASRIGQGDSLVFDPSLYGGGFHWLIFENDDGRDSLLINIRQKLRVIAEPPAGTYHAPLSVALSTDPTPASVTYWLYRDASGYTEWSGKEGTADTIDNAADTIRFRIPAVSFGSTWNDTFKLFMNAAGAVSIGVRIGGRTTEFIDKHIVNGAWGTAEPNGDFLIEIFALDGQQTIVRPMPSAVRRSADTTAPGTPYTQPIVLYDSYTIQAIAAKPGFVRSDTLEAVYTILPPRTPRPVILPENRIFQDSITVSIICDSAPEALIYYTLDGGPPTRESPVYQAPFTVRDTMTVQAAALASGRALSEIAVAEFVRIPARVSTPWAEPKNQVFEKTLQITLHDSTPEAVIRYTLDGSEPNQTSPAYDGSPITIDTTTRLRAKAYRYRWRTSEELDKRYSLQTPIVSAPWAEPGSADFRDSLTISLHDTTPGAVIYYTLDGTGPDSSSVRYTGPFTIYDTTALRAIALKQDWLPSAECNEIYTLLVPRAAMPAANPPGHGFYGAVEVSLRCSTPGAVIHYTANGAAPTKESPVYRQPITIADSITLRAAAFADNYLASQMMEETYYPRSSVARYGYYLDRNADGNIDSAVIVFDTLPYGAPESVVFSDPNDPASTRRMDRGQASLNGNAIGYSFMQPFHSGTFFEQGEWARIESGPNVAPGSVVMYDSAAPVIDSAVYYQSSWKGPREGDQLIVVFSEPAAVRLEQAHGQPFKFSRGSNSYHMLLASKKDAAGREIAFTVLEIDGVEFAAPGDVISIAPHAVLDQNGAVQNNTENVRRPVAVVYEPVPLSADVATNPMRTGAAAAPLPPAALEAVRNSPDAPGWMRRVTRGTAVRIRPVVVEAAEKAVISGAALIYDALGNRVLECPVINDGPGEAWVVWDGRNGNGRLVGPGSYCIVLAAEIDLDGNRYSREMRRYIGVAR